MRLKVCILSVAILCILTACTTKQPNMEYLDQTEYIGYVSTEYTETGNNEKGVEGTANSDEAVYDMGIPLILPENTTWIANRVYNQSDENSLEVMYYDTILEADCTLSVVKDGVPNMPAHEYDETLNEVWEAKTISNQQVSVKVQKNADNKAVLASWTYDNYTFVIWGNLSGEQTDISSIPKTAIYIINNLH